MCKGQGLAILATCIQNGISADNVWDARAGGNSTQSVTDRVQEDHVFGKNLALFSCNAGLLRFVLLYVTEVPLEGCLFFTMQLKMA